MTYIRKDGWTKKQFSEAATTAATATTMTTRATAPMVTWQNILKLWKSHFQNFWTFIINCLVFIKHKMRIIPELQFHNCGVHYKTFLITILVQRLWSHLEGYRLYITSQVSVPVLVTTLVLCLGIQIVRHLQLQQLRRKYDDSNLQHRLKVDARIRSFTVC